ncbi:DUF2550 family protein [Arsenicicoccus dermatophilus]|uniref:DUF2550 family protein n=1 Tax=Arsenicicoccus dermatophilus TaxID=1076331 RepID=UPI0039171BE2
MGGGLAITEVVAGGLVVIGLLCLGLHVLRRQLIAGGAPMFVCAFRADQHRWRYGLGRFDTHALLVYPLMGATLRPALQLQRRALSVQGARRDGLDDLPITLDEPVLLDLCADGRQVELAVPLPTATAMRSWHEATSPGLPPRAV